MADIITRLKLESNEYNTKIKRATQELQNMERECRKVNGTLSVLEKDQKQYIESLGRMETVNKSARGSIAELTSAYTELRVQYNRLTEAEKKGDFGKAINSSLAQLKTRIMDGKNELQSIQGELSGSKFGKFGGVLDDIGKKMGINANITELLTSKTARMSAGIGALIGGLGLATSEWIKYNKALSQQTQITTVTTGLKGDNASAMTDRARALVDTYGGDFREIINAANTLMTQFGKSGDEAMELIRKGMQGMIQGDGPKLLSMIQQYAPSFRDAGISASQLVAIIHNSEGGIFTDQNMNAIVMGIKNIRLMTNSTREALAKLGIDGQKMSEQLNNGTMTIFEALKKVTSAIQGVDSSSQAAGEVMQQVFGRQGAAAGTKLGEAIATLNTNLEETRKQTGELGEANDELYQSYTELNTAIREAFGYDGWEEMAKGIKSKLVSALADVIEGLAKVRKGWQGLLNDISGKGNSTGTGSVNYGYNFGGEIGKRIAEGATPAERQKLYDQWQRQLQTNLSRVGQEKHYRDKNGSDVYYVDDPATQNRERLRYLQAARYLQQNRDTLINGPAPKPNRGTGTDNPPKTHTGSSGRKTAIVQETEKELTIQQQIAELEKEAYTASGERRAEIGAQIRLLDEELAKQKAIRDELHGIVQEEKKIEPLNLGSTSGLSAYIGELKKRQGAETIGSDKWTEAGNQLTAATDLSTIMSSALAGGLDGKQVEAITAPLRDALSSGLIDKNKLMEEVSHALSDINALLREKGLEPIVLDVKTNGIDNVKESVGELSKSTTSASSAMNTLGGAIGSLEDPSAKVAGIVMQAIGNVALGFSHALATPKDPWSWIAFAAAGTATMISTIASIHSATGYANGGIVNREGGGFVPGNSYSGDQVRGLVDGITPVGLNSGELVLNKAQTNNLATALRTDGENGGMRLYAVVKGEDIYLSQVNYRNRTGKGEYVRTRRN